MDFRCLTIAAWPFRGAHVQATMPFIVVLGTGTQQQLQELGAACLRNGQGVINTGIVLIQ